MTQVSGDMTSGDLTVNPVTRVISPLQDYRITGLQQDKFGLIN